MRCYGEESFGPVLTVVAVDGGDEAVRVVANDTEYGLSGAVFGRNVRRPSISPVGWSLGSAT
jgi:vanillin dehydrogenase